MKMFIFLFVMCFSRLSSGHFATTGTYVPYFNKVQTNDAGKRKQFEINPYIGIGTQIFMTGDQYFLPEFGYSYYLNNASNSTRDMIFWHYNFGYALSDKAILRYGLTTHWYRIKGKGGTTTLNNGESFSEFRNPDRTRTSYFTTLNLGAEHFVYGKKYSVRFDLNMMEFVNFFKRTSNYILTFNGYF